ncbi:hypothetical protein GCM10007862_08810 [Dyella lipolytica]|uniref:Uncharacterized protein n=1 Tax=Dyella lipolytica TaxID=1867835 RepID=A0ABW8IXZ6_9GAMM|nr:hypothetical protein [Dyella lipolytica]GLQ45830.1 hypothetical protein GCM10007862_08810 [Dyella lipolytica]
MSDLLQRLVERARGVPESASLRIAPLLTPHYAPTRTPIDTNRPQEIHAETIATTNEASRSTPHRTVENTLHEKEHGKVTTPIHEQNTQRPPPHAEATATTSKPRAEPARAADRGNDSLRVPSERADDNRVENTIKPAPQIAVRPSQRSTATRPSTDVPRTTPATVYDAPVIEESTQTITISIGHVEVRNTSAPAPAPSRRPVFRPAISLDAFLKRGGGDER